MIASRCRKKNKTKRNKKIHQMAVKLPDNFMPFSLGGQFEVIRTCLNKFEVQGLIILSFFHDYWNVHKEEKDLNFAARTRYRHYVSGEGPGVEVPQISLDHLKSNMVAVNSANVMIV